jgi:hypothetical protein
MSDMPEMFDTSETADMAGNADVQVTHDEAQSRFVVELDGERALAAYKRREDEVHFTHTEVPPSFEGRGVGSALAKTALDWAVAERLSIVPRCGFIAAYVKRHAEYQPHVAEEWR